MLLRSSKAVFILSFSFSSKILFNFINESPSNLFSSYSYNLKVFSLKTESTRPLDKLLIPSYKNMTDPALFSLGVLGAPI